MISDGTKLDPSQNGVSEMIFVDGGVSSSDDSWSSPFSIDDVGDFQVEFSSNMSKVNKKAPLSHLSMNTSGRIVRAWHMPNENNYFKRLLRVIVTTQDDATIFIKICKPKFPEYYIYNDTESSIEFQQYKCQK